MTTNFIKADYDAYDPYKYLILDFLIEKGWDAQINPDKFGVDILAYKDASNLALDVEVKKYNWTDKNNFPFNTVHFTTRKQKFIKDNPHLDFYYFIISHNKIGCYYQSGVNIYGKGKAIQKFNKRINTSGYETFYELTKDQVRFISLQ